MHKLSWISDENLFKAVYSLLDKAKNAKKESIDELNQNIIDPFSAMFTMAGFDLDYDNWIKAEEARQAQKTLQNFIGEFHQIILGTCNGWINLHTGNIVDLVNNEKKIIAEIKNKYNTISGGKLADLYWSLESAVMNKTSVYKGYTSYYVTVIPKKPIRCDIEFTPSDKEKGQRCPTNPLIRLIDGASFYAIVTGVNNALKELFDILPTVITEITGEDALDKKRLEKLFQMAYGQE